MTRTMWYEIHGDNRETLKPYLVKKANEDLQNVISVIQNTMNPFVLEPDNNFNCLTTAMKVAEDNRDGIIWKDLA